MGTAKKSAAQHTPGPWHYDGIADATLEQARRLKIPFMILARGCTIAEVIPQDCAEANAALIAAAPALAAVAQALVDAVSATGELSRLSEFSLLEIREFAVAAIAKARP